MNRLIFDRTIQDVENATLKGQYNASDLNRVESWCVYLRDQLNVLGYPITITTKTTWQPSDMRTASEMERIRANIKKIMQGFYYLTNIENNAEYFNYIKANNWEEILYEIYYLMFGTENWYVYGGVARGGQPRLWQHRFRQLTGGASFDTIVYSNTNYYPRLANVSMWIFDTSSATTEADQGAKFNYTDATLGAYTVENLEKASTVNATVRQIFLSGTAYAQGLNKLYGIKVKTPKQYCIETMRIVCRYATHLTITGVRKNGTTKVLYDEDISYYPIYSTTHIDFTAQYVDEPPLDDFFESINFYWENRNESYTTKPAIRYIYAESGWILDEEQESPSNPQGPVLKLSTETGNILTTESGEELEANL